MGDLRERRRLDTRNDIAAAAIELFEAKGVAGTTVDEIAQRAGISPRTFFRYFATKEESVLSINRDFDDEVASWLDGEIDSSDLLGQFEAVHEAAIRKFANGATELGALLLRTRSLIMREPALQDAAIRLDIQGAEHLAEHLRTRLPDDADPLLARLVVDTAATTMRIAFDEWARRRETDDSADLGDVYASTRSLLRGVVDPR